MWLINTDCAMGKFSRWYTSTFLFIPLQTVCVLCVCVQVEGGGGGEWGRVNILFSHCQSGCLSSIHLSVCLLYFGSEWGSGYLISTAFLAFLVSNGWNVKCCFLGKIRNIFQNVIWWNFYLACQALKLAKQYEMSCRIRKCSLWLPQGKTYPVQMRCPKGRLVWGVLRDDMP